MVFLDACTQSESSLFAHIIVETLIKDPLVLLIYFIKKMFIYFRERVYMDEGQRERERIPSRLSAQSLMQGSSS